MKFHGLNSKFRCKFKTTEFNLLDSIPVGEACKTLLDKGAYLVCANCTRGPEQIVEVIEHIVVTQER